VKSTYDLRPSTAASRIVDSFETPDSISVKRMLPRAVAPRSFVSKTLIVWLVVVYDDHLKIIINLPGMPECQ